ncbi:GatB/YqeY domain-containing protein [Salsipaludibacter albus]|uniref:GatB/YqeY domain-containing protein n=1 Tax=Salsipaludibacter albus TaxID=2849650 RepID=UPI001EE43B0E
MSLQTQITDDLKTAMKARDRERMAALRLLVASMKNAAVEAGRGPQGELSDDEIVRMVQTEVKKRREAAQAFREGGRDESADTEEYEAEVYADYLPTQLEDDELGAIVDRAIAETGATDRSGMGQVMKTVMAEVGGRADGKRVSGMVAQRLS